MFQESVQHSSAVFLADLVQTEAVVSYAGEPSEHQIQQAAERMNLFSLKSTKADLWAIEFTSFEEATSAKARLDTEEIQPSSFDGYAAYEGVDYRSLRALSPFINKAPLNQTVVLGAGSGWFVLHVISREEERQSLDDVRNQVVPRLKRQLPIIDLVQQLRADRPVEVDTVAFNQAIPE